MIELVYNILEGTFDLSLHNHKFTYWVIMVV